MAAQISVERGAEHAAEVVCRFLDRGMIASIVGKQGPRVLSII